MTTAATDPRTSNGSAGFPATRCPGLPKYSVPPHAALVADFGRNRHRADGKARTCRACNALWRQLHAQLPPTAPTPAPAALPAATAATTTPRTVRQALAGLLVALAQRIAGGLPIE